MNPENTFYSVKRFIGRRMDEVDEESKVRALEALLISSESHGARQTGVPADS